MLLEKQIKLESIKNMNFVSILILGFRLET